MNDRRPHAGSSTQLNPDDHVRDIAQHIREVMWKVNPNTSDVIYANPAMQTVYGISPADLLTNPRMWLELVHEDDRERLEEMFRRCATEPVSVEFRIVRPDGQERWLVFHGDPIPSEAGVVVVGICEDITKSKRAEFERQRSVSLLRATLDSTADGILVVDVSGKIASYNEVFVDLWRIPADIAATGDDAQLLASVVDQLVDSEAFLRKVEELYKHPEAVSFDVLLFKDGRVYERYSRPQYLEDRVVGRVWSFRDATARRRAEEIVRFLAEASRTLASSLDYTTTLNHIADLVVPALADWMVVDVIEDSRIRRVVSKHRDPDKDALMAEITRLYPPASTPGYRERMLRAETEFVPEVTREWLDVRTKDEQQITMLFELGLRSIIIAPLVTRERVLGVMVVASAVRSYTRDDLSVVQDLALRAATALDNAMLYEASQLANKAKSDFLAVMSHELRTPLAAITGYADLIDAGVAGPVTGEQHAYLARVQLQAQELLRIISEILTYSRMEAERERIRIESFELHPLLQRVVDSQTPFARDKGLTLRADLSAAPDTLESDPTRLENILANLLSNAIKFTSAGSVELTVAPADDSVLFRIRDTGIGIAPEFQSKIFDPFYQIESAMTREKGGTGLGLAVARRLARLLGGDIEVESEPGKGSTFTLRLPTTPPPSSSG